MRRDDGRSWISSRIPTHVMHKPKVYYFCHSIKVNQQTQEDFICGRTVFVDSTEITQNCNCGHVFTMKSQHTRRLRAHGRAIIFMGNRPVQMIVLSVVRRGDFRQKTGYHFDNVSYRHGTNFILTARVGECTGVSVKNSRSGQDLLTSKALDMR